jgi:hypothetical protein
MAFKAKVDYLAPSPAPAAPTTTPAPAVTPVGPPQDHQSVKKAVRFKVDASSISSSKAFESVSASDDDQFLGWGGSNEDATI